MALKLMTPRWATASLLAVALSGCDFMSYDDNVEGWYSYGGTVDDAPGYTVNGELRIHGQYHHGAYADIEWYMLDGTLEVFQVIADDIPVDIDGGRVRFTTWGDLELTDGGVREFELSHDARVGGHTMRGDWWFETGLPSRDEGPFTARR